jgi:DNA-binding response OmpR family regulator
MRILVIEDDEKIASFIVNGLKQSGFSVDHASDGEAAADCGFGIHDECPWMMCVG